MIHGCKNRQWYIKDFLYPSLVEQGIEENNIKVWMDDQNRGNLMSFINSLTWIKDNMTEVPAFWHLQDDVIISENFFRQICKYNEGIVCGFCCQMWKPQNRVSCGLQPSSRMWYSFPCIRIPNKYVGEFLDWFWNVGVRTAKGKEWFRVGKFDDSFFWNFVTREKKDQMVWNVQPNLVDHVDWLIGGSQINKNRNSNISTRAIYWEEEDRVQELRRRIEEYSTPQREWN